MDFLYCFDLDGLAFDDFALFETGFADRDLIARPFDDFRALLDLADLRLVVGAFDADFLPDLDFFAALRDGAFGFFFTDDFVMARDRLP